MSNSEIIQALEASQYQKSKDIISKENKFYNDLEDFFICKQDQQLKIKKSDIRIPASAIGSDEDKLIEISAQNTEWFGKKCLILNLIEITHIIKLEQIKSENKYKTLFLRTLNHEVRHPITAIQSCYKRLKSILNQPQFQGQEQQSDIENCFNTIKIIKSETQFLMNKILQIQDITEIQNHKFEVQMENFNLQKIVKKCVNIIDFQAKRKGLQINIDISNQIPAIIQGDQKRVQVVLLSLLQNSLINTKKGFINICAYFSKQKEKQRQFQIIKMKITDSRSEDIEPINIGTELQLPEEGEIKHAKGLEIDFYISQQISLQIGEKEITKKRKKKTNVFKFQFFIQDESRSSHITTKSYEIIETQTESAF